MKDCVVRMLLRLDPSSCGRNVESIFGISCGEKKRWQNSVRVRSVVEMLVMPVLRFLGKSSRSSTAYSGSHGS